MDRTLRILVQAHSVRLPAPAADEATQVGRDVLATLANNLTAFGWGLSKEAFEALMRASDGAARAWWEELEPVLMELTGADRKMDEHVVYKNFPHEVLAMSEADYWLRQILMYWGLPNEWFASPAEERAPLDEKTRVRVLHAAKPDTLRKVFRSFCDAPARWTPQEQLDVLFLAKQMAGATFDLSTVAFKENMATLAAEVRRLGGRATVSTATDALRLVVAMSGGDVSLREKTKIRKLSRAERRFVASLLESAPHLEEDFARRPELFKRLVHQIHAGDWPAKFPRTIMAAKKLYEDTLPPTTAAVVEQRLVARDARVLDELKAQPGEMMRRLHHLVLRFGRPAAEAFVTVLPRLTVFQLVKIERYLSKVNERRTRTFPPKGSWSNLQIVEAPRKRRIPSEMLAILLGALRREIGARVAKRVPSVALSRDAKMVKLPTNDSDLTPYGRGTVFPLPANVRFVRTATYWSTGGTHGNVWYDNGWNFFDGKWRSLGACCWSSVNYQGGQAIFSGDPTSSKDAYGRACQMIDLYLDKLTARYAVWNVLCYSRVSFDDAKEVFAALQWGVDRDAGKIFEPSRTQLAFPVKGPQFTKYVALLDIARRQLVYLDANLRASVSSAASNGAVLTKAMPAFLEYLDSLPSVHDVFAHAPASPTGMPVLYTDLETSIAGDEAYVFRPENQMNRFRPFPLMELLSS